MTKSFFLRSLPHSPNNIIRFGTRLDLAKDTPKQRVIASGVIGSRQLTRRRRNFDLLDTLQRITNLPGNQSLVEVGISAAGMHEKGAERDSFRVHHAAFLHFISRQFHKHPQRIFSSSFPKF